MASIWEDACDIWFDRDIRTEAYTSHRHRIEPNIKLSLIRSYITEITPQLQNTIFLLYPA